MALKYLLLATSILLASCTDADETNKILSSQGYTEIKVTGWAWLGCSEDDTYRTKFTAKSINGSEVSGVVCSGVFKGGTVRFR